MNIFDFFKKRTDPKPQVKEETKAEISVLHGAAISKRIDVDFQNQDSIRNCFIAFDVETTGLSPTSDRIVEIGAVIFKNGAVHKVFSSLINPGISISHAASAVNNITNAMLATAPSEKEIYPQLIDFLGDALCGKIVMCAHNAKFDFDFLCNTLSRLGFNAYIEYVDTLTLSRKCLHGLDNYRQKTIEDYFGLVNCSSHRAASDAENCGHILFRLLDAAKSSPGETKSPQTQPVGCIYGDKESITNSASFHILGKGRSPVPATRSIKHPPPGLHVSAWLWRTDTMVVGCYST